MINPVDGAMTASTRSRPGTGADGQGGATFGAALEAAQRAAARREQHDREMNAIADKGFTDWARDTQIEKLKEKLRRKIMAQMGLDENSLSLMTPVMQEILQRKIEEELERQLAEAMPDPRDGGGRDTPRTEAATSPAPAQATPARQDQPGKNDRDGKTCPVIPVLAWPGGPSLF